MLYLIEDLSNIVWWNNSVLDYIIFIAIFLGLLILFRIFRFFIIKKLKNFASKTKTSWDDLIIDFIKDIKSLFYIMLSIYISLNYLIVPEKLVNGVYYILLILAGVYIAKGISNIINNLIEIKTQKSKEKNNASSPSMIRLLGIISKIIILTILFLMILSNMGIEITPLIASLGVGGIAIALALQSILGDLFGAFIIYFDKPFKEGDFIISGSDMGVVKRIGIKSTRIQALQGQELVISNTELINSRINNYKQMEKRRIAFSFGVKYNTSIKKLKKIKNIVIKIFDEVKGADLDRIHFKEFGNFSLNYEVVYYVKTSDYNVYMDIQETINLKLYSAFEKEGIEFAFPTQTIELEK